MDRLLVATTNPDKLREIRGILSRLPVEIMTLRDLAPVPEPEETGETFAENARLKALYYDAMAGADLAPAQAPPPLHGCRRFGSGHRRARWRAGRAFGSVSAA